MSKSVGNVISLPDLLGRYDPRAYRLLVLQAHYRSPLTVTPKTLTSAGQGMERLDALARRFPEARMGVAPDAASVERFRQRMDDDLGTVQATAELFDVVKRANSVADQGDAGAAAPLAAAVYEMCRAVGLEIGGEAALVDEDAQARATARDEARRRGDYAAADSLRAQLQADGWIVEDTPAGTVIRR
jgi:cysteinyl-tRNA synthetase